MRRFFRRCPGHPVLFAVFAFSVISSLSAQDSLFLDSPSVFSPEDGMFPRASASGNLAVVAWQETEVPGALPSALPGGQTDGGSIFIAIAVRGASDAGWTFRGRVAGPFSFSRKDEPSIFSLLVDTAGRIFICVARSLSRTEIYFSDDRGATFSLRAISALGTAQSTALGTAQNDARSALLADNITAGGGTTDGELLVPRLFQSADGAYLMFVARGVSENLTLYYARSADGLDWSAGFRPFVGAPLRLNFLPAHAVLGGRDFVVFQSFIPGTINRPSFQLYITSSDDGGRSWSAARRLTDFMDPVSNTTAVPDAFGNERAHLSVFEDGLFLVWERRFGASYPSIYGALLNRDGQILFRPERINTAPNAASNNPVGFPYQGKRYVFWFDNRTGNNSIYLGRRLPFEWENLELSRFTQTAIFPKPVLAGDTFFIFWQDIAGGRSRIWTTFPDISAPAPEPHGLNFTPDKKIAGDVARIAWNIPYDPSGIEGFSWSWSQDSGVVPPNVVMGWTGEEELNVSKSADADGRWYFKIRAKDIIGNWSPPAEIVFVRDRTPPPAPRIRALPLDARGFARSNDFNFRWDEAETVPDLAGFSWKLDYLGPAATAPLAAPASAAVRNMGRRTSASYENEDNGLWRFTVYALDDLENVSAPSTLFIRADKYIPHTFITYVDASQELMGDLDIAIIGRGFAEGGDVNHVFLKNADGGERILSLANGDFTVKDDREIVLNTVENLASGIYHVLVEHPLRGLAQSTQTFVVGPSLTYKFGDYTRMWAESWFATAYRAVDVRVVLVVLFIALCAAFFVLTVKGMGVLIAEGRAIQIETRALLKGSAMPSGRKKKLVRLIRRGVGLRIKLSLFTVALVIIIVAMVSVPLYMMMTQTQQRTLKQSLWDRAVVLLDSMELGARTYLRSNTETTLADLAALPNQANAMSEALYATITGYGEGNTATDDYVWASNDPEILSKTDTAELLYGVSRLSDGLTPSIAIEDARLNETANITISGLSLGIAGLNLQAEELIARGDAASLARLEDIQITTRELEREVTRNLSELSSGVLSYPQYDVNEFKGIRANYTLVKPVMFRQSGSTIYVRGWIRLIISSVDVVDQIQAGQQRILGIILIVALAAIIVGTGGALILSRLIVLPILSLVAHVEKIRDTEDKTKLEGVDIVTKSRDEIGILGETINEMTRNLVKAAQASVDLSLGKEIQKKFIPLEIGADGNKSTTGSKETKFAEFFGYYEGAKGVSGDYFDYRDLDGRHFAIIKCDVAGKGIPAALIMIQVATMFINFFRRWKIKHDVRINDLVYEINEFIEQLGFKGRFAAFTLCLFDSETGVLRFCNAGDNLIHYYDASEKKVKTVALPQTPATGVLPNSIVESGGGYKMQSLKLDAGDILLLYTDGIEEAKRKFRDHDFNEVVCAEGGAPQDTPHANHSVGQDSEELGADRVETIINAVMNRRVYDLYKYHNPHGDVRYHFDFTNCTNRVEDLIMALVSVEKIFRLWRDPETSSATRILVDKKIDAFLRTHFIEYSKYISHAEESHENHDYLYYFGISEDEQYDDLTILGIKRK
jgi:hypothetical protein